MADGSQRGTGGGSGDDRDEADRRAADRGEPVGEVEVKVCIECGKEYTFERQPVREDVVCEKCGNKVFRSFFGNRTGEEEQDFQESTGRDTSPDAGATDVEVGDLLDLNHS